MTAKLYVGNVSYDASGDDLSALFAEVGTVVASRVIVDRITGKSRGFGFVEMASDVEAETAIGRFNGHRLFGRTLLVHLAHDNRELSRRAREAKTRQVDPLRQPMAHHAMGNHSMGNHSMGNHSMGNHSMGNHTMGMGLEMRAQDMRDRMERMRRPMRHGLLRDRPM